MRKNMLCAIGVTVLIFALTGCGTTSEQTREETSGGGSMTAQESQPEQTAVTDGASDSTGDQGTQGSEQMTTAQPKADDGAAEGGSSAEKDMISEDEAKELVVSKVSGTPKKEEVHLKLDVDDGRKVYEGSVVHQEIKYEFEIDAQSGEILEWEEDSIYD